MDVYLTAPGVSLKLVENCWETVPLDPSESTYSMYVETYIEAKGGEFIEIGPCYPWRGSAVVKFSMTFEILMVIKNDM